MGRKLTVRAKGHGDSLKSLTLDEKQITGNRLTWEDMQDGCIIVVGVDK